MTVLEQASALSMLNSPDDPVVPVIESEPQQYVIDNDGDLRIIVQSKIEFRVSRKILSMAAPVFASMFSGRWAEGQRLLD